MSTRQFPCTNCGARIEFDPSVAALKCPYCGHECAMPAPEQTIEEHDFHEALAQAAQIEQTLEAQVVKCETCGASTTFAQNITACECAFCGTPIVIRPNPACVLRPRALLPFHIVLKDARARFADWINSRWFAPNCLKTVIGREDSLKGMYVPYWTYDCQTFSDYTGERGTAYYVSESYTTTENGKTVTRTRQVRKIRWTSVSGHVELSFDDILILASRSLPDDIADKLQPWDLENLVPFAEDYLGGFQAEAYGVGLEDGFEKAKSIMDEAIRRAIRRDIGGDEQRIHRVNTHHDAITFKHILLPIWISAYRYKDKTYRFLVNARTGEVQGQRPWSWLKITLAVLGGAALIGGAVLLLQHLGTN